MNKLALAILAILLLGSGTGTSAQEKISVRLDLTPGGSQAALHLAVVKGWFKEVGLDVDVQDGRGSVDTLQLVASGQVDFGWVGLGPMAVARENGLNVKSVAGVFRKTDLAMIVDEQSPIKEPKDIRGKRVAVFTTSTWVPFIDPFLRAGGLTKNDVEMVYVAPATLFATYAAGQADALLSLGPFALPLVNPKRKSRAILAADYGIVYPSFGLVVKEDSIAARRHLVANLVKVVMRSWKYIYDGHEEEAVDAVQTLRPGVKLDHAVLLEQLRLYRDFLDTPNSRGQAMGVQNDKDWEASIKSMEGAGLLKPGRKPAEFYTNEFVD